MLKLRDPGMLAAGVFFLAAGSLGLYLSLQYRLGSALDMGPGFFPSLIAGLLMVFALAAIGRAFFTDGEALPHVNWRLTAIIVSSTVAFGLLIEPLGLAPALFLMVMIASLASRELKLPPAILVALVMTAFSSLIFVEWLGVPVAIFGTFR